MKRIILTLLMGAVLGLEMTGSIGEPHSAVVEAVVQTEAIHEFVNETPVPAEIDTMELPAEKSIPANLVSSKLEVISTIEPVTEELSEANTYGISEEDIELLARLLYTECRGESRDGWLLVSQCVLNRLEDGAWGDTIREVIYYPKQFAKPGKLMDELLEAARCAANGERYDPDVTILYFDTRYREQWYGTEWLGKVGGHHYYGYEAVNLP